MNLPGTPGLYGGIVWKRSTRKNVTQLTMHDEYSELAGQGVKPLA